MINSRHTRVVRLCVLLCYFPNLDYFFTGCEFARYESSLSPAVRPCLEDQLDKGSDVDADLCEIAHHMLDWDSRLATPLKLTEADVSDIKQKYSDPELQR